MKFVSTAPIRNGLATMRRPLSSTSVRCGPKPRRLTLPEPSEPWARASNWLVSPSTPLLTVRPLIISSVEGEPCFGEILGRDDVDRQRCILGGAADVGTGDDDDFGDFAGLLRQRSTDRGGENSAGAGH